MTTTATGWVSHDELAKMTATRLGIGAVPSSRDVWLLPDGRATLRRQRQLPIGYLVDACPCFADGSVQVQLTGEAALMYGRKIVPMRLRGGTEP